MSQRRRFEATVTILEQWLDDPDIFYEEAPDDIPQMDRRALRAAVVKRMQEPFSQSDALILTQILDMTGLGKAKQELARLVTDTSRGYDTRGSAITILLQHDMTFAMRLMAKLDPDDRARLESYPMRVILNIAFQTSMDAIDLHEVFLPEPDADPMIMFTRFDDVRRDMGLFPSAIYDEDLLLDEDLESLHEPIIDAMVEERDPGALSLFRAMLEGSDDDAERRVWQQAILRLGTAMSEHVPSSPPALARFIAPQYAEAGAVSLLIDNPDGTKTLTMMDLDPTRRDDSDKEAGLIMLNPYKDLIRDFHAELGSPDRVIAPGIARSLVDRFAEGLGEAWFDEPDREILNRLLQAWRIREAEPLPEPPPLKSLAENEVHELFEDAPYDTWMLNMDVPDAVQLDDLPFASPEWEQLAVRLIDDDEEQRSRLVANLDAMTVYHMVGGEERLAAIAQSLARAIESKKTIRVAGFDQIMVAQTIERLEELIDRLDEEDPEDEEWEEEEGFDDESRDILRRELLKVVDNQLRDRDDLPFVYETFERLKSQGMSSDEARRAIASIVAGHIFQMMSGDQREWDRDAYKRDLAALTYES